MVNKDSLFKILSKLANDNKNSVNLDSRLIEDLGFDSLLMVNLIMEIENEFDIILSDSDYNFENFRTPLDILNLIENHE